MQAHRLRDVTPSKFAKAKEVIEKALQDSSAWGDFPYTAQEYCLQDPDLPQTLTIGAFNRIWADAVKAETEKY